MKILRIKITFLKVILFKIMPFQRIRTIFECRNQFKNFASMAPVLIFWHNMPRVEKRGISETKFPFFCLKKKEALPLLTGLQITPKNQMKTGTKINPGC
jgi:hypothetical protein